MDEPISFVKVPIDPEDLDELRETLELHGATVTKFRKPVDDCWYLILLPVVTIYTRETRCIFLPDRYIFLFHPGRTSNRWVFLHRPTIALLPEEKPV